MAIFKLTAPCQRGRMPAGYSFLVNTGYDVRLSSHFIEEALKEEGFSDRETLYYSSDGYWKVEKISN